MIVDEEEYLVVYPGHNAAVLLYQRLKTRLCNVELVSTPSKVYSGCTKSIKFEGIYMDIVKSEINKIDIKPKGVYKIIKRGQFRDYYKL